MDLKGYNMSKKKHEPDGSPPPPSQELQPIKDLEAAPNQQEPAIVYDEVYYRRYCNERLDIIDSCLEGAYDAFMELAAALKHAKDHVSHEVWLGLCERYHVKEPYKVMCQANAPRLIHLAETGQLPKGKKNRYKLCVMSDEAFAIADAKGCGKLSCTELDEIVANVRADNHQKELEAAVAAKLTIGSAANSGVPRAKTQQRRPPSQESQPNTELEADELEDEPNTQESDGPGLEAGPDELHKEPPLIKDLWLSFTEDEINPRPNELELKDNIRARLVVMLHQLIVDFPILEHYKWEVKGEQWTPTTKQ
jgi:hypothetical protein